MGGQKVCFSIDTSFTAGIVYPYGQYIRALPEEVFRNGIMPFDIVAMGLADGDTVELANIFVIDRSEGDLQVFV